MKTTRHQSVESELEHYRKAISADVERLTDTLSLAQLRERAVTLAKSVWENPKRRWLVLGALAGGAILLLLLRRRNSTTVEHLDTPQGGTQVIVQPRPQNSLVYQVFQELLRYTLLLLAKKLLEELLGDRKGKAPAAK